jgi:hypothetical protein
VGAHGVRLGWSRPIPAVKFFYFQLRRFNKKAYETFLLKVFFISVILFSGEHDVRLVGGSSPSRGANF